ncbi:MAG: tRNA (adenosine(37)-N6)-threonylcarbamoyltransferase complex dimerization subunit type 1 TsaB [Terriglobales bacterium]
MLLLGVDTSGKQGSIALATGNAAAFAVLEVVAIGGGTFSAQLIPQVAALLARHQRKKEDLDAFVVATGPGSFTGLRIGLAAVKALAEVLGKPIAAVSLLEAVAAAAGLEGAVLAALDAGRGEVFAGEYEVSSGRPCLVRESLLTQDEFLARAQATDAPLQVATPDDSLAQWLRAQNLPLAVPARPRSDLIARLGLAKLLAGETVTVEALDANYLRRSNAELFSSIRGANSKNA